jgi:hypothetical protein
MPGAKYAPGEDGRYHCEVEGCGAAFDRPQPLGAHRIREHGLAPAHPQRRYPSKRGRPPKSNGLLSAEDVCRAVLIEVAPNGMIPVDMIDAYVDWVDSTRAFLLKIGGR